MGSELERVKNEEESMYSYAQEIKRVNEQLTRQLNYEQRRNKGKILISIKLFIKSLTAWSNLRIK